MKTPACKSHGHAHSHWLPKLDAFGATAAFMCALHCALLPVAMVILPLATVEILANHRFEQWFVAGAVLFGSLVMGSGISRSHIVAVSTLFMLAVLMLLIGLAVDDLSSWHALTMATGGMLLATAHAINRHFTQAHADGISLWKELFRGLISADRRAMSKE